MLKSARDRRRRARRAGGMSQAMAVAVLGGVHLQGSGDNQALNTRPRKPVMRVRTA
jgi:hypothetical protein